MASEEKLHVVLIVLYDSDKRLLLQHRTTDAKVMPGYWAFFGGGIKEGETLEAALRREAMEELDYVPISPKLFMEQDFIENNTNGFMHVFIEPYYSDKSMLKLKEGQGWGWYKASETDELKMIERDRAIVKKIDEYINSNRSIQREK